MIRFDIKSFLPSIIVLSISIILVSSFIYIEGGNPIALARIGTRYLTGDSEGSEGYDGQFIYFIAAELDPLRVTKHLDVPAYRYQRILLPFLAHIISLGKIEIIPWAIVLVEIIFISIGTWAVGELLVSWRVSRWYSLVYGCWAGFMLAIITDLPEPIAYALVALGILMLERKKFLIGCFLFALSAFAKEVTLIFIIACLVVYITSHQWKEMLCLGLIGVLPYLIFQLWLISIYNRPGFGSGGEMATPFEWIPFMGLFRIGYHNILYLIGMLVVFVPTIVFPVLWGIWKSVQKWFADEKNLYVVALFLNALILVFTPFSTFRETGGIIRHASGLVLAVILFAGFYKDKRALNYSVFWLVLNVFILK